MHKCSVDHTLLALNHTVRKHKIVSHLQEKFHFVTEIDFKQTLSDPYMFP